MAYYRKSICVRRSKIPSRLFFLRKSRLIILCTRRLNLRLSFPVPMVLVVTITGMLHFIICQTSATLISRYPGLSQGGDHWSTPSSHRARVKFTDNHYIVVQGNISCPMHKYEEYKVSRTSWGIGVLGSIFGRFPPRPHSHQ